MGHPIIYHKGQKLHPDSRLVFVKDVKSNAANRRALFKCDCGNTKVLTLCSVKIGHTKCCGCVHPGFRHGGTINHFKEHSIWLGMRYRCYNEKHKLYPHYGGRGIKVCSEWRRDFPQFLKDMGERPTDKHSIDRTDNNGDYAANNCRWVLQKENARNQRTSKIWTIKGVEYPSATSASKATGISASSVQKWCKKEKEGYSCRSKY